KRLRPWRPMLEAVEDRTLPSTCTVMSLADSGAGTLRECLQMIPQPGLIDFNTPAGSITLQTVLPDINSKLNIQGPGVTNLTVQRSSAAEPFRIFKVGGLVTVEISNMTIANGFVVNDLSTGTNPGGGGIYNEGTLTVSHCLVTGNVAQNNVAKPTAENRA